MNPMLKMSHESACDIFNRGLSYYNVTRTIVLHLFCRMANTSLKCDFWLLFDFCQQLGERSCVHSTPFARWPGCNKRRLDSNKLRCKFQKKSFNTHQLGELTVVTSTVTRSAFDNYECHLTAFRPISEWRGSLFHVIITRVT